MSNQASEDEQAMQHICQQTGEHYYASESIPGGLIHWIRICMTCGHKDGKDLNEQVETLIRTEKLKAQIDILQEGVSESKEFCGEDVDINLGWVNFKLNKLQQSLDKLEAEL